MENKGEKKEKRMELVLPFSLYHKLMEEQIKVYRESGNKPSIASLIRDAIRNKYK